MEGAHGGLRLPQWQRGRPAPAVARAAWPARYALGAAGYLLLCLAYWHLPAGATTVWGTAPGRDRLLAPAGGPFDTGPFLLLAGAGLAAALLAYARLAAEQSPRRLLLASALAFLLVAAVAPPILDSDAHAYADVGIGFARGYNPYAVPAADQPPTVSRPFNYWADIVPAYGPLWLLLGRALAPLGLGSPYAAVALFRLVGVAAVLAAAALLARLRGVPAAARFAWHPLVVITAVWGAHLDALVLALLLAAALAARSRRAALAAAALGGAIAIKAVALLALPLLLAGLAGRARRLRAGATALGIVALLYAPFCLAMGSLRPLQVLGEEARRIVSNPLWLPALVGAAASGLSHNAIVALLATANTLIGAGIVIVALALSWHALRHGPSLSQDTCAALVVWSLPFALFAALAVRSFPWYWIIPLGLTQGVSLRTLPDRILLVQLPLVFAFTYVLAYPMPSN